MSERLHNEKLTREGDTFVQSVCCHNSSSSRPVPAGSLGSSTASKRIFAMSATFAAATRFALTAVMRQSSHEPKIGSRLQQAQRLPQQRAIPAFSKQPSSTSVAVHKYVYPASRHIPHEGPSSRALVASAAKQASATSATAQRMEGILFIGTCDFPEDKLDKKEARGVIHQGLELTSTNEDGRREQHLSLRLYKRDHDHVAHRRRWSFGRGSTIGHDIPCAGAKSCHDPAIIAVHVEGSGSGCHG